MSCSDSKPGGGVREAAEGEAGAAEDEAAGAGAAEASPTSSVKRLLAPDC